MVIKNIKIKRETTLKDELMRIKDLCYQPGQSFEEDVKDIYNTLKKMIGEIEE